MQVSQGGLQRLYLKPFPLSKEIPSLEQIIKNPKKHILFLEHVTRNHKGLNWKIYRYQLTPENYKSFLYAFAYEMAIIDPNWSTSWQVSSNAKRLKKALKRDNIFLSRDENDVLNICLDFTKWKEPYVARKNIAAWCQVDLVVQYNLFTEYIDATLIV